MHLLCTCNRWIEHNSSFAGRRRWKSAWSKNKKSGFCINNNFPTFVCSFITFLTLSISALHCSWFDYLNSNIIISLLSEYNSNKCVPFTTKPRKWWRVHEEWLKQKISFNKTTAWFSPSPGRCKKLVNVYCKSR